MTDGNGIFSIDNFFENIKYRLKVLLEDEGML